MMLPGTDQPCSVLLISADAAVRRQLQSILQEEGCEVQCESDRRAGLAHWQVRQPEIVMADVGAAGGPVDDPLWVLREIVASQSETQVIVLSAADNMRMVVEALRLGAADFLLTPLSDPEVLVHSIQRAFEEHQLVLENRLYREALEQKNLELNESLRLLKEDQEAGRAVQLKLLPPAPRDFRGVSIDYHIIPSLYLSGDFVDFFSLGEQQIGFYLADVSGHGASSAFVTVLLKTCANRVRQRCRYTTWAHQFPLELLQRTNEELIPLGLGKHLAIFAGYLDMAQNTLRYCSAAHFPPPILTQNGRVTLLEGKGLPVGLFEDASYDDQVVAVETPFQLTLFSDGVLELLTDQTIDEKTARLVEIVASDRHNVRQLLDHLNVSDQTVVPDDIAVMTVTCTGTSSPQDPSE